MLLEVSNQKAFAFNWNSVTLNDIIITKWWVASCTKLSFNDLPTKRTRTLLTFEWCSIFSPYQPGSSFKFEVVILIYCSFFFLQMGRTETHELKIKPIVLFPLPLYHSIRFFPFSLRCFSKHLHHFINHRDQWRRYISHVNVNAL